MLKGLPPRVTATPSSARPSAVLEHLRASYPKDLDAGEIARIEAYVSDPKTAAAWGARFAKGEEAFIVPGRALNVRHDLEVTKGGLVAVLLDRRIGGGGATKKVTRAALLFVRPGELRFERGVLLQPKDARSMRDRNDVLREGRLGTSFQDARLAETYAANVVQRGPDKVEVHVLQKEYGGGDVHSAMAAGPIVESDRQDIMLGMADSVAALHALGKVHGDVKPQNFLLERPGLRLRVALADFELADDLEALERAAARPDTLAAAADRGVGGHPGFMSPDQSARYLAASGAPPSPAAFHRASDDVFALAVSLWMVRRGALTSPLGLYNERDLLEARGDRLLASHTVNAGLSDASVRSAFELGPEDHPEATRLHERDPLGALLGDMLRVDPSARITASQAAERLGAIFGRRGAASEREASPLRRTPLELQAERVRERAGPRGDLIQFARELWNRRESVESWEQVYFAYARVQDVEEFKAGGEYFYDERPGTNVAALSHRVYVNGAPEHLGRLGEFVRQEILRDRAAFPGGMQTKVADAGHASTRADNLVIYVEGERVAQHVAERLAGLEATEPELFRPWTPRMTRPVSSGVSIGEDPPGGTSSFGQLRAKALHRALSPGLFQWLTQGSPQTFEAFLARVEAGLRSAGVDPERPDRNLVRSPLDRG